MTTNTTNEEIYYSPSVKVIQLMGQNVICQSDPTASGPNGENGGSLDD